MCHIAHPDHYGMGMPEAKDRGYDLTVTSKVSAALVPAERTNQKHVCPECGENRFLTQFAILSGQLICVVGCVPRARPASVQEIDAFVKRSKAALAEPSEESEGSQAHQAVSAQ